MHQARSFCIRFRLRELKPIICKIHEIHDTALNSRELSCCSGLLSSSTGKEGIQKTSSCCIVIKTIRFNSQNETKVKNFHLNRSFPLQNKISHFSKITLFCDSSLDKLALCIFKWNETFQCVRTFLLVESVSSAVINRTTSSPSHLTSRVVFTTKFVLSWSSGPVHRRIFTNAGCRIRNFGP